MIGRIFLGRYEAIKQLGEGGMGRVYLARQLDLGRQVVVKVMHDHIAADSKFRERFQRETLLMARFQHPYVVALYDASLNDPQGPCIVMEYIRGLTLDTLLQHNGKLSPMRAGRLLGQLCEALQAAHQEGIIHRDLKPTNLMVVDPDTPYEKIKVMDFGLAKLLDPQPMNLKAVSDTNMEFGVGTPGYICPEQICGEKMDHRGDLYSVGVILYELLTGRPPFDKNSTMDLLLAHATETPATFASIGVNDWVPPAIEAVVMACLAKDPRDRPQSARDLAERYETALAHQEAILEDQVPPEHPRAHQATPALLAVAATPATVPITPTRTAPAETDPHAVVHHLEAWMPEKIAAFKLRGFVHDVGGEVLESVPGLIRVRLGQRPFAWLGFGRRNSPLEVELRLQQGGPTRGSVLHIVVLFKPPKPGKAPDAEWRARCDQVYCELRGYLMGNQSGA
jgi:serine/threonine protein kinase